MGYGFLLLYVIRNELEQSDYKLIIVAGLDGRKTLCPLTFAAVSFQMTEWKLISLKLHFLWQIMSSFQYALCSSAG